MSIFRSEYSDRMLRRLERVAFLVVLVLACLCAAFESRAQACSTFATLTALAPDNGYRNTFTFSVWDCTAAHEVADFMGITYLGNCSSTSTQLTFHAGFVDGQQWDYTYTREACAEPPPPPASAASASEFSTAQSLNALLWGFLVLLVGVGYQNGRIR